MSIIKKLMNRFKSLRSYDRAIEKDLKRLNTIKTGLGDQAVSYVRYGDNETVLSSLSTLGDNGVLNACYNYLPYQDKFSPARCRFIAASTDKSPHLICRYIEVLNAVTENIPDHAMGSKHVPNKLRIFFTEMFNGDVELIPANSNRKQCHLSLSPEEAFKYCAAFDASAVDFFDVLYQKNNHYYRFDTSQYRQHFALKDIIVANAEAALEAGRRISAQGKKDLIDDIVSWKLVESPEFLQYLLDQAGQSAKEPQKAALNALKQVSSTIIEPLAINMLQKGTVAVRAGMVELLTSLGTESALEAMVSHKANEKTARIIATIDNAVLAKASNEAVVGGDDANSYVAINNEKIIIPDLKPLATGEYPDFCNKDRQQLQSLFEKDNKKIRQQNEEAKKQKFKYKRELHKLSVIDELLDFFSGKLSVKDSKQRRRIDYRINYGPASAWAKEAIHRLPQDKAVSLCVQLGGARGVFHGYSNGFCVSYLRDYLNSEEADFRHLEAQEIDFGLAYEQGPWGKRVEKQVQPGDLGRAYLAYYYGFDGPADEVLSNALWPYVASHLDILDEAFGLASKRPDSEYNTLRALELLAVLPETPMRYLGPLLEMATGSRKQGRSEAKLLLADLQEVNDRLLVLLTDSRQDIRAGAAKWISERAFKEAVPAIRKQLKKEKSPVAKAALLTTLRDFDENLDDYIGPDALLEEANQGLKKAKLDSLEWLAINRAPKVNFVNGDPVPETVIQWWCFLAVKLKQPGGNGLFELYQEQLKPNDAEAFSSWVLDSWVQYDTTKPSQEDTQAYAKANAKQRLKYFSQWDQTYTEERAFRDLMHEYSFNNYLNSGAASKGLLAFARYAPASVAADKVRAYLKNHGSRTSQASSLLELLAAKGDAVSLQVVIAAATRLKQKGVQKFAGELLERVAESKNWTLDELADRTIPTAGMDDSGVIELICTEQEKRYQATLDADLNVVIQNPDGKVVKGLPSGTDDNTKAAKKQLSATKKEVKQVVAMQGNRLHEALCAERIWSVEEWLENYQQHPLMCKLIERLVWLGLDDSDEVIGAFRPTAEGDYTDADDNDVSLDKFAKVRLAHGVLMDDGQVEQWYEHLDDYEVKPLFKQFGRPLLRLEKADSKQLEIDDRRGFVTNTFALRGNATRLGYERGAAEDGGVFWEYTKTFRSTGLVAVVEFSGNCLPEENVPAALTNLSFMKYQNNTRRHQKVKLADVPPVLLSECWNDYHELVANTAYDKDWEKKMPWM